MRIRKYQLKRKHIVVAMSIAFLLLALGLTLSQIKQQQNLLQQAAAPLSGPVTGPCTESLCPTPTATSPTFTPVPVVGDVNGDRSVDLLDFNIWRDEFLGMTSTKQSNLNNDEVVDLLDFNLWLTAYRINNP